MDVPQNEQRRARNTMPAEGPSVLPIGDGGPLEWGDSVDDLALGGTGGVLPRRPDPLPQCSGWGGLPVPTAAAIPQGVPLNGTPEAPTYWPWVFATVIVMMVMATPLLVVKAINDAHDRLERLEKLIEEEKIKNRPEPVVPPVVHDTPAPPSPAGLNLFKDWVYPSWEEQWEEQRR